MDSGSRDHSTAYVSKMLILCSTRLEFTWPRLRASLTRDRRAVGMCPVRDAATRWQAAPGVGCWLWLPGPLGEEAALQSPSELGSWAARGMAGGCRQGLLRAGTPLAPREGRCRWPTNAVGCRAKGT